MTLKTDYSQIIEDGIATSVGFRAVIQGTDPGLLMHNPAGMQLLEKFKEDNGGARKKVVPPAEVEAEWATYRDADGYLVIPAVWMQRCLVEAGKMFRSSTRKMASMAREFAAGISTVPAYPSFVLINDAGEPMKEYEVDVRRAIVQRQGIMRARPFIRSPWQAEVWMQRDATVIDGEACLKALMLAGQQIGIGDYRPEKSGPFGRFEVVAFDDVEV